MKVVLLAGGYGTRISEESHLRPKISLLKSSFVSFRKKAPFTFLPLKHMKFYRKKVC